MDRQLIRTLIDALQSSGLSELEYASGGETLRLVKGGTAVAASTASSTISTASEPSAPPVMAPLPAHDSAAGSMVVAPLYGVVHLHPAPGAAPFVSAGQAVKAGTVLCTVEAMKVFTEIRADRSGTLDAVLVADGQEVEPGQPLLRLA